MEGMAGIISKGHFESTVSRAHHANKELAEFPNFKVYGAIALNRGSGGINPGAVEVALASGAKLVWLPTLDAENHARAFGGGGTYGFKAMTLDFGHPSTHTQTYTVFDQNKKLSAETKAVIDVVAHYDAILATGHLSKDEIYAVAEYANLRKHTRTVVTHPEFTVPDLDLASMVDLGKQGIFMEFVAGTVFPIVAKVKLEEVCEYVDAVGVEHCILSSDGGQPFHPKPPEMLRSYVQALHEKGMPADAIRRMCIDNPAYLLNVRSNNPPTNGHRQ
jgi:hypothetical protein